MSSSPDPFQCPSCTLTGQQAAITCLQDCVNLDVLTLASAICTILLMKMGSIKDGVKPLGYMWGQISKVVNLRDSRSIPATPCKNVRVHVWHV